MPKAGGYDEIECKFLDIDKSVFEDQLLAIGATKQFSQLFKRTIFDYPDWRLDKQNAWLRVRDEGSRITVSYKQRQQVAAGKNDSGMREVEIEVDDFDNACEIYRSIGMVTKFYEENRRTQYILDGVEVCIDEWPLIPPYVELEGESWQSIKAAAVKLGLEWQQYKIFSTMQVYDVYGINERDYTLLTFDKQVLR